MDFSMSYEITGERSDNIKKQPVKTKALCALKRVSKSKYRLKMAGETMVFHPPSAINTAGGWVCNQ